ncbi:hypothetical protein [Paenibacillus sp. J22TS3]|uniref:hypothetical protein n=1 Tax=Paenibacillus sp. J22TS3 TaxID=2807192 RepID=UPI001B069F13|nr:hypothetical protein [Paenibacillus sp. J22TS3]GIP23297.1 hypothetical protein J22TS3_35720 [Paenibacillus sp. J22TS3]
MFNKTKILLSSLLVMSIAPLYSAHAEAPKNDKFSAYIQEAIQDELALHNVPLGLRQSLNANGLTASLDSIQDPALKDNIEKLQNAEVTIVNFDSDGAFVSAENSERGDITKDFVFEEKKDTDGSSERNSLFTSNHDVSIQATPNLPGGGIHLQNNVSGDGAFHRLTTPASSASKSYTGAVADDITFPAYDIATANKYGEAGYLYTGFDGVGGGYAEVGFGTASSSVGQYPTAWFPLFHGTPSTGATKEKGPGSSDIGYWYDTSKPYTAGQTVSGYKVYYKTNEPYLKLRYLIGNSELYVVNYPNVKNLDGMKVKRLTTIGQPKQTPQTTPFHVGWSTPAKWGNYRFLTNNGTSTAYPGELAGLSDQTCLHGGKIYFLKNVISSTDRDESYWIYLP